MRDSGRIELDGDRIRYRSAVYGTWDLQVADVRIVGETTNQDGPGVDDYFLCFATGLRMWYEASFYAAGRDELLSKLRARFRSNSPCATRPTSPVESCGRCRSR